MQENVRDRQPIRHYGLKSPLFLGAFFVGMHLLILGNNESDHHLAVYTLAIAATAYMTNNKYARAASILGGAMRALSSPQSAMGQVGFFAQAAGILYAYNDIPGNELQVPHHHGTQTQPHFQPSLDAALNC